MILKLILNHKSTEYTQSLLKQVPDAVVIDASGDFTFPEGFDKKNYIKIKNHGFTANWNTAIRKVQDREWTHICLMNNDIVINTPDFFEKLQKIADEHPEIGILSAAFNSPYEQCNPHYATGLREVVNVEFTAPIIRRDVLDIAGGFPEEIVHGWGVDFVYCEYVKQLNYKIAVYYDCIFQHIGGRSAEKEFGSTEAYIEIASKEFYDISVNLKKDITRTFIINELIKERGYSNYLEIGYGDGANWKAVNCAKKTCVDPFRNYHDVVMKISDEFFREAIIKGTKYDIIFIDGDHREEYVDRDSENALKCLKDGGAIIWHDVNPPSEWHTRPIEQFGAFEEWCGTAYRSFLKFRNKKPFKFFALAPDFGIGVMLKEQIDTPLPGLEISWKEFDKNRREYLNLITIRDFYKIVKKDGKI